MAEFEYIMRQANRMCDTQTICNKECPAYMHGNCCVSTRGRGIGGEIDYTSVAKAVIDWAKDHPEPVYPSWRDDELAFWQRVRDTCAAIGGKPPKKYSAEALTKWYNSLHG